MKDFLLLKEKKFSIKFTPLGTEKGGKKETCRVTFPDGVLIPLNPTALRMAKTP